MKSRLGKFYIELSLIENPEKHPMLMKLMGRVLVVRAETLWHVGRIEYVAMSEYFEPVPQGQITPEYLFSFDRDTGDIKCQPVEAQFCTTGVTSNGQ